MAAAPTTPVKDLPKEMLIGDTLKGELLSERVLKPCDSAERNVLPTAADLAQEEIQAEKTIQGFLQGVEAFAKDSLKDTKTREPASPSAVMQAELARDSSLKTVSGFDLTTLKKAETQEKNSLPGPEAIAQEMEHLKFKAGIEGYDQASLSHTNTVEKNTLPTQEIIAMEKSQ